MTVRELIAALQQMPQDAIAVFKYDGRYVRCSGPKVKHLNVPTERAWGDYVKPRMGYQGAVECVSVGSAGG